MHCGAAPTIKTLNRVDALFPQPISVTTASLGSYTTGIIISVAAAIGTGSQLKTGSLKSNNNFCCSTVSSYNTILGTEM